MVLRGKGIVSVSLNHPRKNVTRASSLAPLCCKGVYLNVCNEGSLRSLSRVEFRPSTRNGFFSFPTVHLPPNALFSSPTERGQDPPIECGRHLAVCVSPLLVFLIMLQFSDSLSCLTFNLFLEPLGDLPPGDQPAYRLCRFLIRTRLRAPILLSPICARPYGLR